MANKEQLALLEQGVEVWNRWRRENPEIEIDLRGAILDNYSLSLSSFFEDHLASANSFGINFSKANLEGVSFKNTNLYGANFDKANLNSTDFSKAEICGCGFRETELAGVLLHNSMFVGSDFTGANLYEVNLSGLHFLRTDFTGAILARADLSYSIWTSAKLSHADLRESILAHAQMEEANLYSADLSDTQLDQANLSRANLTKANILNADLSKSSFVGAKLIDANLYKSNLCKSDLHASDLSRANLEDTLLNLANVAATNFTGSILTGACLTGWNISSATNFKDVFCDYIFLGFDIDAWIPVERRPRDLSENFEEGEFETLYQVFIQAEQTIDLTFSDGIDWQSFFQSLQGVHKQYPDAGVGLQAIEKKGSAFIIRLETVPDAPQAEIESTQKDLYNTKLQLNETKGEVRVLREWNEHLKQLAGKTTMEFNAPVGNAAGHTNALMKATQHNDSQSSSPSNPWITFLGWFQNGQAIVAIIALGTGVASTYFIPKLLPNGFPPVNSDTPQKSIQTPLSAPQIGGDTEKDDLQVRLIPDKQLSFGAFNYLHLFRGKSMTGIPKFLVK